MKQNNEQRSLVIKAAIITTFVLLMLIPISWLKSMINERKNTTEHMINEVGSKWGESQTIRGPILVLPLVGNQGSSPSYAYFMPEDLHVVGNIEPKKVSQGIVEALCYESTLNITGTFAFPAISKLGINPERVKWDQVFFMLSLSDMTGIRNKIDFTVDNQAIDFLSNSNTDSNISGLLAKFPLNSQSVNKNYSFQLNLSLNGMNSLLLLPTGKYTSIELNSVWDSVNFVGDFLPNNESGFPAKWEIYDYNRSLPQMWIDQNIIELDKDAIGVQLQVPVSQYQKILRSVKYAVLFIVLTFTIFFLIEIVTKKKIHPIQYLLVSFALVMFYTLLLSLSEHIGYDVAYLIAGLAVIIMITAYSRSVLRNLKQVLLIAFFLISLYTYLYIVVQSESMSLLFGSIGLFIMLGIVMYTSRNVDWYGIREQNFNDKDPNIELEKELEVNHVLVDDSTKCADLVEETEGDRKA